MTRLELAAKIASLINAEGTYMASAWTGGRKVRVYLKEDAGRKKGIKDKGYGEVREDGTLDLGDLDFGLRYLRDLLTAIKSLPAAEPESAAQSVAAAQSARDVRRIDEDEQQHIDSAAAIAAAEINREIG